MNIVILGSGGWGTALANLLAGNGHNVALWSFSKDECENLKKTGENPLLKGIALHKNIEFTNAFDAVCNAQMVVFATPSFAIRATAEKVREDRPEQCVLVSVTKGIEAGTSQRMSQIIENVTGRTVAVLSGPSHAEEVGRGVPTGCVAACAVKEVAELVQDTFMCDHFRVYSTDDVVGVELGAALKNVIALCAGVSDGMGCGDNTKALLMTRGLTEIARLGLALGSRKETFAGLTGVGDLIVTCTSMHSRNRRAGILIGQGKTPEEAMKEVGAVVEGFYAAKSAWELAQKTGVNMPITREAYGVLYEGKKPAEALSVLMTRRKQRELEDAGWENYQ